VKLTIWHRLAATGDPVYRKELTRYLALHRQPSRRAGPATPGRVVEFLKGGRCACGVLLCAGSRVHRILDTTGKDRVVDRTRVVHFSEAYIPTLSARHDVLETLRDVDRLRDRLKATVDAQALWEVVQPEGHGWTLQELADLCFSGIPGPHACAALFRALEDSLAFRRQGHVFIPLKPEAVAKRAAEVQRVAGTDSWLHDAAAWLRTVAQGGKQAPPPKAETALELLAAKVLFGSLHEHAAQANVLAKLAHFHGWRAIFEVLVKLGRWAKDENLDLLRYATPIAFTDAALAEARAVQWPKRVKIPPRLRRRNVYACVGHAAPIERAFSVRRERGVFGVAVHVATPVFLIQRGGLIQQTAAERAVSLRLPDRSIPMLPRELTNSMSLTENAPRSALSVHMEFDARFRLTQYRFEVQRVRVTRLLTDDEANGPAERDPGLRKLLALARQLRDKRTQTGAVPAAGPETEVAVADGRTTLREIDPDTPARLIDRELSILVNTLAGRLCAERRLPALYRIEASRAPTGVTPDRYDPLAPYRQQRNAPKVILQTQPVADPDLGAGARVSVTAPFARYEDLLAHQQIIGFLEDGRSSYSTRDLDEALRNTAFAREAANEIERSSRRYWLLRHLEPHVGETMKAVTLERVARGCLVELPETRLTAFCPLSGDIVLEPDGLLQVVLTHVSARAGTLRLRPAPVVPR
jgi:exoribonuclease-2